MFYVFPIWANPVLPRTHTGWAGSLTIIDLSLTYFLPPSGPTFYSKTLSFPVRMPTTGFSAHPFYLSTIYPPHRSHYCPKDKLQHAPLSFPVALDCIRIKLRLHYHGPQSCSLTLQTYLLSFAPTENTMSFQKYRIVQLLQDIWTAKFFLLCQVTISIKLTPKCMIIFNK